MKKKLGFSAAVIIAVGTFSGIDRAQVASNPPYTLEQSVIAAGGGTSTGSVYQIVGTVGQPVAGTTSTNASFTLRGGFFTPAPFAPTAALASVSGRVLTADGRGIRNVAVMLTGAGGETRMAFSSSFGYFTFENVQVGEVYILSVRAKQFQFSQSSLAISVQEDLSDINFIANPQ